MCGHVFMYYDPYRLQRHRPVWRCGTCGREAYVPLDCCTRPDFAPRQHVRLGRRCAQGLVAIGRWALISLGTLLGRHRHPAVPAVTASDDNGTEGVVAEAVVVGAEDDAETAGVAGTPVAAGEHV